MSRLALLLSAAAMLVAAVGACAQPEPPADAQPRTDSAQANVAAADTVDVSGVFQARARVQPAAGGRATGVVTLTRIPGGTRVQARLDGLSSREYHALQILRGRTCDADPDVHLGADAGTPHGGPYAPPGFRHIGDLGSVRGDEGVGRYDRIAADLSLAGTTSPVGRAVVVRQTRDDATSAGGAAGAVIGCGIFEEV